jgi:hypothetical protein
LVLNGTTGYAPISYLESFEGFLSLAQHYNVTVVFQREITAELLDKAATSYIHLTARLFFVYNGVCYVYDFQIGEFP